MKRIYIVDILRKSKTIEMSDYKDSRNSLLSLESLELEDLINKIESTRLLGDDFVDLMMNSFFPKNFSSQLKKSPIHIEEINQLKKIIDNLFMTDLENNSMIDSMSIDKLVGFMIDEIVKKIVKEYYLKNLYDGDLITSSENAQEFLEFEFMNRYKFLSHYFESSIPFLTILMTLQRDLFIQNVELNDNSDRNYLEEFRKFYNILISAFSTLKKDFDLFKISIKQDKRLFPKKREIIKYDCYASFDDMVETLENVSKNIDLVTNYLLNDKRLIDDRIKNLDLSKKENIKFYTDLVSSSIGNILKYIIFQK